MIVAPDWLHVLSIVALILGFVSAGIIMMVVFRHPQHMWIMNVVWPVAALFGTVPTTWGYFRYGRLATEKAAKNARTAARRTKSRRHFR